MGLLVGQVKEGFLADMLVVEGDPGSEVSVPQDRSRIRAILKGRRLKGGRFVRDTP
jgi:imidazolonepropionase-like amidohydrolase